MCDVPEGGRSVSQEHVQSGNGLRQVFASSCWDVSAIGCFLVDQSVPDHRPGFCCVVMCDCCVPGGMLLLPVDVAGWLAWFQGRCC